jgi:ABC-type nitrate/sulfonate/bicarbonate transport system substrate-binding protein
LARRLGLKVIDVPFLPMVWFTTVSTGLSFVEKHPDIVDKFLKGICEGIAYFKTHRAESIKIIKDNYKDEGELDDEAATHLYEELKMILQAKPYATIQAISNVYEISIEQDKTAEKTDPMALWDFHYLRRIDDSGFIDNLYRT